MHSVTDMGFCTHSCRSLQGEVNPTGDIESDMAVKPGKAASDHEVKYLKKGIMV